MKTPTAHAIALANGYRKHPVRSWREYRKTQGGVEITVRVTGRGRNQRAEYVSTWGSNRVATLRAAKEAAALFGVKEAAASCRSGSSLMIGGRWSPVLKAGPRKSLP